MIHLLKTQHDWYCLARDGFKNVEIRKNDRDFRPGDIVYLADYIVDGKDSDYTCDYMRKTIKGVFKDVPGLKKGYVLLVFEKE